MGRIRPVRRVDRLDSPHQPGPPHQTDPSHPRFTNHTVFSTETVTVGRFRCAATHPRFTNTGPVPEFCVVFPRTSVWIQHRDDTPFVADPSIATVYNQGQEYTRARIAPDGDRCEWFGIAPEVLREIVAPVDPAAADSASRVFRFTHAACDRRLYARQRLVFDHVTGAATPDRLFVEESVLHLVGGIVDAMYGQRAAASAVSARHRDLVQRVRSRLAGCVTQPITLGEIGRAVGVSMFHLARVFARVTGMTIHQYRRELRVRRALELLLESKRDLLEVALQLGYSGHSHFTAEFRQAFGLTPSAFRTLAARRPAVSAGRDQRLARL
jgi:AraC-like DNA-binding protein